jgi:hypothetical protein
MHLWLHALLEFISVMHNVAGELFMRLHHAVGVSLTSGQTLYNFSIYFLTFCDLPFGDFTIVFPFFQCRYSSSSGCISRPLASL